jgi:hypothetical protein
MAAPEETKEEPPNDNKKRETSINEEILQGDNSK